MPTKTRRKQRTKYPSQDKIDQDIANHLAAVGDVVRVAAAPTLFGKPVTNIKAVPLVLDRAAFLEAAGVTCPRPTKAQRALEYKRVAEVTAPLPTSRVVTLTITKEREAQARFAAHQLVSGQSIMLTDDSILAMAQFIEALHG